MSVENPFSARGFDGIVANARRRLQPCPQCGPKVATIVHPFSGAEVVVPVPCDHQSAALAEAETTAERKRHYDRFTARNDSLRLPAMFSARSLADFDGRPCWQAGLQAARKYLATWPERFRNGQGLVLTGAMGTGKTSIAYAIAKAVDALHYTVFAMSEDGLIKTLRADRENAPQIAMACQAVDLLVLDDLAIKRQTELAVGDLFAILQGRHDRQKPTIITTNHSGASMVEHFVRCLTMGTSPVPADDAQQMVTRAMSRLRQRNVVVQFEGADQRMSEAPTWLAQ